MSQIVPVEKQIGEHKYKMFMLPPMQSHDLLMDVLQMVGPSLGPVLDVLMQGTKGKPDLTSLLDIDLPAGFFESAAKQLFANVNKDTLRSVIMALKSNNITLIDGKPLDSVFDAIFLGRLGEMYQWLLWGMRVQWGGCFGALANVANGQGAELVKQ